MPAFDFHGTTAHYETWGDGRPLIALHAGGSSGKQWQRVASVLQEDHRLIAPDLIGFGQTVAGPDAGPVSHDLQADLIVALIAHTAATPVDVVGHSYGGATAARLVLRYPDLVRSLVLIEPILTPLLRDANPGLFEEYWRLADEFLDHAEAGRNEQAWALFLDYRNGPGTWAGMADGARARFLGQTAQTADGFRANLANPTTLDDCRTIQTATTIVCGELTTAPDKRVTELLNGAIPGSRYVTIPAASHMSPLTHPEETAKIIRDHLDRIGEPGNYARE